MTDNVEVKLGAQTGDLKSSMADASSSVAASLAKIAEALQNFGAKNQAVTRQVRQDNSDLSRSFGGLGGEVQGAFGKIEASIVRFRGIVAGLGAVLAGGMLWKSSVDEMLRMESEVRNLENVMGMMSDKATQTAIALKIIGSSSEVLTGIFLKLGRQIKADEQGLNDLGVTTRDVNTRALLPADEILQNAFKTMLTYKAGTDQAEFALKAFGRGAGEVYDIMVRLPAAQERAAELMKALNIEMGPERQAAIEQYRLNLGSARVVMSTIGEQIGAAVLPSLMRMSEWFAGVGPSAITIIVGAVKGFLSVIQAMGTIVGDVVVFIVAGFTQLQTLFIATGKVIYLTLTGQWTSIPAVVKGAYQQMVGTGRAAMETIVANTKEGVDKIKNLWKDVPAGAAGPGPMPSGSKTVPMKATGGAAPDDRLAQWKDELLQMQEAEGYFNELSKTQEADFWTAKLALVKGGGDAEVKLRRELNRLIYEDKKAAARSELQDALATFQLEIDAAKNNKDAQIAAAVARTQTVKAIFGQDSAAYKSELDKELKIREEWVKKEAEIMKIRTKMIEDAAAGEIEMERQALDQGVALRRVSAQQAFAVEVDLENKLYALKRQALEDERALLQEGTKERLLVDAQIESLERTHQKALTSIQNEAEKERQAAAIAAANAVENSVGTLIDDLITHTKTLKQTWMDFVKGLTASLNQIASQQIAKQLFGAGTGGGDMLNKIFGNIFGGGASGGGAAALGTAGTVLTTAGTALTTASAALDASATALSSAAAALAAGGGGGLGGLFGGGGGGGGFGLFDAIAGYAVGTPYVPQDSLAFVHKGEAIIPAAYNNGGLGGGFNNVNQFNITAPIDTRAQHQIQRSAAEGVRRASLR